MVLRCDQCPTWSNLRGAWFRGRWDQLCPALRVIVHLLLQGCGWPGPLGNLELEAPLGTSRVNGKRPTPCVLHLHLLPLTSALLPVHHTFLASNSAQSSWWAISRERGAGHWLFLRGRAVMMSVIFASGLMMSHQPENPRALGPPFPPGSASASTPTSLWLPRQCSRPTFCVSHKEAGVRKATGFPHFSLEPVTPGGKGFIVVISFLPEGFHRAT